MNQRTRGGAASRPFASRLRLAPGAVVLALALAGCGGGGGGGSGGGGAGGGLRGTVSDDRALARREVEIRAADGTRSSAPIAADGTWSADALGSGAPFLLRVALADGDVRYAVATGTEPVANVHGFTDLVVRVYYAGLGQSVADAFEGQGERGIDTAAIDAIGERINGIVAGLLGAYGLAGTDLAHADFVTDGTGVDRFLEGNPVLIENGTFTIVAIEPDEETQTVVASNVPLATDLLAIDDTAPDAPGGLRALPSAVDEIVLAWEAASDDVAVSGYEVLRDGEPIATTPYPVHLDAPLASEIDYTYAIVALDAQGNRSTPSASRTARTLAAPDTVPPPPPTALETSAARSSVRLRWTQAEVGDVAAFRLLRGVGGGVLERHVRVTTTSTLDAGLAAGTEHCYRVIAVDASMNESSPSAETCATTLEGTAVAPPVSSPPPSAPPPSPDTGPVGGGGAAAALLELDVSGLECAEEIGGRVEETLRLDGPCYRVTSTLDVRDGGTLEIAPGTVVKFGAGRALSVGRGGVLNARGTPEAPIVLSGLDPTVGYWPGVRLSQSNSASNVLENVLVEYGGDEDGSGLSIRSDSRVSATSVAIRGSAGRGFGLADEATIDRFEDIVSTGNATPGGVSAENAALLVPASVFLDGNREDAIVVFDDRVGSSATVERATRWEALGMPWLVDDLRVDAPLVLAPGAELQFVAGGSVAVRADGSLRAVGSADAPIALRGRDASPGFWDGVRLLFSGSTENRLEHVLIEHAGGTGDNDGAVTTLSGGQSSRLALVDVTLRNSQGPGFRFDDGTVIGAFERVVSTANDRGGVVHPSIVASLGSDLELDGNAQDNLFVYSGSIDRESAWSAIPVPLELGNLEIDASLTLAPGTVIVMRAGAEIRIDQGGALNAVGTAAAPISITGLTPSAGSWDGLRFFYSSSTGNRLEHVRLRHGGGGGASATSANVELLCVTNQPSRVAIAESTIGQSLGWGIYLDRSDDCDLSLGANVRFEANAEGDVGGT